MKRLLMVVGVILISCSVAMAADQYVPGHWKDTDRDGVKDTYIDGYHRTSPNNSTYDNYSTKGNTNPWTGDQYSGPQFSDNSLRW